MLCLHLLGRLELGPSDQGDQTSVLGQPKRLALLVYLAIGAGTYSRRDSLLALFWPELDEFAARRALRNTLYQLRLALGDTVFQARGDDDIMVDPAVLWCDAAALREAVAAGRYEEAVELYRGELLDGFHVTNVGEGFETWLARERSQALSLALRALNERVVHYQRVGDDAAAAQYAVRATALAPFDELWLRRAAMALDAIGDRSGAVRLADAFVRRMTTELEAKPSAETTALIERIRAGVGERIAPRPVSVVAPPPEVSPVEIPGSNQHWRIPALVLATLIVVGAAAAVWKTQHDAPHGRERVLITLFENRTGDPALGPLSDMEVDWLARGLDRAQLVDVVDPRALLGHGRTRSGQPEDPGQLAHRIGAALVVTGSYYRSGDSLLFVASVLDGDGRVLRTVGPLAASITRPVDGVEATRSRVTTALASIVDVRSRATWNDGSAPPAFEAYEPFVAGSDAFGLGQFVKAESLFTLAATRDTSFDAANVAVATAAANVLRCAIVDSVVRSLARRGRSLSLLDGLNMRIAVARCHGHNDEMMRLAMQRARALSTTSPLQGSTANAALWANHPGDAVAILERLDPSVDLDWMPTPDHLDYWGSLSEGYHMLGRHDAELAAVDRGHLIALGRFLYRGRALPGLGRSTEALAALDSAFALPAELGLSNGMAPLTDGRPEYAGSAAWVGLWVAHELHVHGDSAAGRVAATHTLAWIDGLPHADRDAPEMRLFEAQFLEQAGRTTDAIRVLQRLILADSANVDYRGLLAGLAIESHDTALANRLDGWLQSLPPERALWGASFYRARAASLGGRPTDAVALVRETIALGAWPYWIHADPALHRLANRPDFLALMSPKQ